MTLEIITLFIAVLGILLFILALKRLRRKKPFTASLQGLTGLLLLSVSFLSISVALNLYTYQQLSYEKLIASSRLKQIETKMYRLYVTFPDNSTQTFDLRGDQWQFDARILKWSGFAYLLGFKTHYRLERISGRYFDINQERNLPRTVYPILSTQFFSDWSPDIWSFIKGHQDWFPWVEATYGSATYLPMKHNAQYNITVGTSGLIARPINIEAVNAIQDWK